MFGHRRHVAARSMPAAVPSAIALILLFCASMALSAGPAITLVPAEIVVGESFQITGTGFTKGSVVNFFVASAAGPVNYGPLTPSEKTATTLIVDVPVTVALSTGVASVQVVNTDEGFIESDAVTAQLFGYPKDGFPTKKLTPLGGFANLDFIAQLFDAARQALRGALLIGAAK